MKNSIIFKTLLILGSVIFAIFIVSGYLFLQKDRELIGDIRAYNLNSAMKALDQRQDERLDIDKKQLEYAVSMIAKNSSEYLLNFDTDGLKQSLLFDIKKDGVNAIQVWDSSMQEIFLLAVKQNNKIVFLKTLPQDLEKLTKFKKDIVKAYGSSTEVLGSITLFYDKSIIINKINTLRDKTKKDIEHFNTTIDTQLSSSVFVKFIINLISLVAIMFAMTLLLRKLVNSPLQQLQTGLDNFFLFLQGKKDSTQNINISSNDEFGHMAQSLNENISVSARLHEEIHELNTNLEERIKEKTAKVTTLLDNAGQGFLTFNQDFIVDDEYSNECAKLLGDDMAGKNITDLLFKDNAKKESFISVLNDAIDEDEKIVQNAFISLLPSTIILNKRALKLEYKILENNATMLILTNISAQRRLEKKIKREQEILKMIVTIVSDSDTFYDIKREYIEFIKSYKSLIDTTKTPLNNINEMYRALHTFKGTFLQLHMDNSVKFLHNLESSISNMLKENISSNKNLIELFDNSNFRESLQKDINIIKDILGNDFLNSENFVQIDINTIKNLQLAVSHAIQQKPSMSQEEKDILKYVEDLSNQKLSHLLKPYVNLTQELATRLEKEIYELTIIGNDDIFISDKYKPFIKSLIHIFRNSVDHGIETPDQRIEHDKDDTGTISCTFSTNEENILQIIISDDGAGINKDKILSKAISQNILTKEKASALSDEEINLLVFHDNFSTKDDISNISGRGVGMSVVKQECEKLNGHIEIQSKPNIGTTFVFNMPL